MKSASKRGTGKAGYPEYVAVIGDFVLVIEDKAALDKHINLTDRGVVDTAVKSVTDYAVNGAYFYAKHIAQNSTFKIIMFFRSVQLGSKDDCLNYEHEMKFREKNKNCFCYRKSEHRKLG